MPRSRAPCITPQVSSTDCMRLTAFCTCGSRSWSPKLSRFTPDSASASSCSWDASRGSTSTPISQSGANRKERRRIAISSRRSSAGRKVGVPPPPMDLHHLAAAGLEQRGGHLDLARQHGKITASPGAIARDGHVAAAEEAAHVAEGDMDIERQWPVRLFTAARQDLAVLERTEVVGELRRRGIRGVAWAGAVVLDDHLPVESDRLPEVVHGT